MSQNYDRTVYQLDQKLAYTEARVKNLQQTLNEHKIPHSTNLKADLYKLLYQLCQTKNSYSIIPTKSPEQNIDNYLNKNNQKTKQIKRKTNVQLIPEHKQNKQDNSYSSDEMNESVDNIVQQIEIPETQVTQISQPLRSSTPNLEISFDEEIFLTNKNTEKLSFDDEFCNSNNNKKSLSFDDTMF